MYVLCDGVMWCILVSVERHCDRSCVSRAFWGFADHFRAQAESLLSSLESTKQKQLLGEQPSNSSSSTSLNSVGRGGAVSVGKTRPMSKGPHSGYRGVESSGTDVLLYIYVIVTVIFHSFSAVSAIFVPKFSSFSALVCI